MASPPPTHRAILRGIARRAMAERGLQPDFPPAALAELAKIPGPAPWPPKARDLRSLPWCSIDNEDSRDLDQLTVARTLPGGAIKVLVAVADVDALVAKGTALDDHAAGNTVSVYTPAQVFPMLPERLSTDLTSLNPGADRAALITEMTVGEEGAVSRGEVYPGLVRSRAQLAYDSMAAWLEGRASPPSRALTGEGLEANLLLQEQAARRMRELRHMRGALDLVTVEAKPVFEADEITGLGDQARNRAREIIEEFMIAANGVTARFLADKSLPLLGRVVRTPRRWGRIVELAAEGGTTLPREPDPGALRRFLVKAKAADPPRFPDLSLSVIKLLGPGEYVVQVPGKAPEGHFGLATPHYTHSTAPNRRFPDLVTHRLLKAALSSRPAPYPRERLEEIALHCTEAEDAARKVERQTGKSAAALVMRSRVGERFEAICTGASPKGTWVRLFQPPMEGKLVEGFGGVDVGHRLRVELVRTDVERGFIDFRRG